MRKVLCSIMSATVALFLCFAPVCLAWEVGRMTGGGSVFTTLNGNTIRVTHGFELHCDTSIAPNNLEINWDSGNHWHLDTLTSVACSSDGLSPAPPPGTALLANVYNGCGDGTFNGTPGVHACWTFTDHGEPGVNDTAEYHIFGILDVPETKLTFGNHQVHSENKAP